MQATTNSEAKTYAKNYEKRLDALQRRMNAAYEAGNLDLYHHYWIEFTDIFYGLRKEGWHISNAGGSYRVEPLADYPNPNINRDGYLPTQALNEALDRFDATISQTFGEELGSIEHFCYDEDLSFTTVRFSDGGSISYRVRPDRVTDDGFSTTGGRLRRGMQAFGLVAPSWCYRS